MNLEEIQAENTRLRALVKLREEEAALAREGFDAFFMQAPIPVVILEGPNHLVTLANEEYERLVGRKMFGKTIAEAFDSGEADYYIPLLDKVFQTGEPYIGKNLPLQLPNKDGVLQDDSIDVGYYPVRNSAKVITGILALVHDVTQVSAIKKKANEALRELATEKKKLEVIVEESRAAIGLMRGSDYIFEIANPKWQQLVSKRDYIGRPYRDIYPELVNTPAFQSIKDTFTNGEPFTANEMKLLVTSPSGVLEDQYFDYTNIRILDGEGKPYGVFCHALNVTDTVVARQSVQKSEEQLVGILESMSDAFFSIDKNWIITRVNAQHVKATKKPREEQLGKNFLELYLSAPEARESKYWISYHKAMEERVPVEFEEYYPPIDLWTAVRVYPTPDGGLAIFFTDTTEQKRAEKALRHAIEARDIFLGIASHELKTPLTSLKLQTQGSKRILEKRGIEAFDLGQVKKVLENTLTQTERLSRLVDDMLDVSRIASGKLGMTLEKTDVSALLNDTIKRFTFQLEAVGCNITSSIQEHIVALIDAFRFEQVWANLFLNITKYAPGKPVEISLKISRDQMIFKIRDHGPGIPKDKLDSVFERFERLHSSDNISGLGLGLHISREIVESHHGKISVQSELGDGAEFTIAVPLGLGTK